MVMTMPLVMISVILLYNLFISIMMIILDINECLEGNGGSSCEYDSKDCVSTCINTSGYYNCCCSQGYDLNVTT